MPEPKERRPRWLPLCDADELPERAGRRARVAGHDLALFRTSHGAVMATIDRCPHRGGPLSEGIVTDHTVICPLHGWKIDLVTGAAVAPDRGCVRRVPAVVVDGRVYVDGGALDGPAPRPMDEVCGVRQATGRPRIGFRQAMREDFTVQDFDRPIPVLAVEPPSPDTEETLRLEIADPDGSLVTLGLADLRARFETVTLPAHLVCLMFGFTHAVTWTGVRVADVLRSVGGHGYPHVAFYSWDTDRTAEKTRFFETLPRDYAMDPRTLLAFGMDGGSLPKQHGGPLRLVVPFLQGYKSVKWLTRIVLSNSDPVGYKKQHGFIEFPELSTPPTFVPPWND